MASTGDNPPSLEADFVALRRMRDDDASGAIKKYVGEDDDPLNWTHTDKPGDLWGDPSKAHQIVKMNNGRVVELRMAIETSVPNAQASPERHTTHMRALQTQQTSPTPRGASRKKPNNKLTTPSPSETGPSPSAASTAPRSSGRGRAAPPASSGTAPAERRRAST